MLKQVWSLVVGCKKGDGERSEASGRGFREPYWDTELATVD